MWQKSHWRSALVQALEVCPWWFSSVAGRHSEKPLGIELFGPQGELHLTQFEKSLPNSLCSQWGWVWFIFPTITPHHQINCAPLVPAFLHPGRLGTATWSLKWRSEPGPSDRENRRSHQFGVSDSQVRKKDKSMCSETLTLRNSTQHVLVLAPISSSWWIFTCQSISRLSLDLFVLTLFELP